MIKWQKGSLCTGPHSEMEVREQTALQKEKKRKKKKKKKRTANV